ncbi:hypothetical protein PR048_017299 [Dryococelus australis]|uniref:Endonuclease/exonuclease/phosphatase domain-containing protein n=1 Tax=Dryococelus australis TaxID=614101 RepID=A0ABQ9H947_9NEOP|nr:hypothetical protein PR048_017299 [Dryococelus australis]
MRTCAKLTKKEFQRRHDNKSIKWYCGWCDGGSDMANDFRSEANPSVVHGNELKLILQKLNKESVEFCAEKFDEITNDLKEVRHKLDDVLAENKLMLALKIKNEELKQYLRRYKLELHGIPLTKNDNTLEIVKQTASALGIKLSVEDIDPSHHLSQKQLELAPAIIEEIMKAKKKHLTTASLALEKIATPANRPIHINENLTLYQNTMNEASRTIKVSEEEDINRVRVSLLKQGNTPTPPAPKWQGQQLNTFNKIFKLKKEDVYECQIALKIVCLNARSSRNKLDEVEALITTIGNTGIITVSESWINSYEKQYYNIEEYDSFFACRYDKIGGGTCMFVKSTLWTGAVIDVVEAKHNFLHVQLDGKNVARTKLHIIICYNPSKGNYSIFLKELENVLMKVKNECYIVLGDLNIDSLGKTTEFDHYNDLITTYGFTQCNTLFPTRCTHTTSTFLDDVLINSNKYTYRISNIGPLDNSISDHSIIVCDANNNPNINTKYNIDHINIVNQRSNINYDALNNYLRCVLQNLTLNDNSNSLYNMLIQHIEEVIKANSTTIDVGPRTSNNKYNIRNTWVTEELVHLMHRRDVLH